MTADKDKQSVATTHPIPVPYAVLALAWVVALIASNRFLHEIPFFVWLAGPALLIIKVYLDAEMIGKAKDNPPPVTYNLHAHGVWAQLEQTIKTLPTHFKNVSPYINYQLLNPPKGMPMQLHATITLHHPEVDRSEVAPGKQNKMESTLTMESTIKDVGGKSILSMRFTTDPLVGRKPLDDIIDHIRHHVDSLVSQHIK